MPFVLCQPPPFLRQNLFDSHLPITALLFSFCQSEPSCLPLPSSFLKPSGFHRVLPAKPAAFLLTALIPLLYSFDLRLKSFENDLKEVSRLIPMAWYRKKQCFVNCKCPQKACSRNFKKICMGHKLSQQIFLYQLFFEIMTFSWRRHLLHVKSPQ